jgi:RNA polymerase primary sigma factor
MKTETSIGPTSRTLRTPEGTQPRHGAESETKQALDSYLREIRDAPILDRESEAGVARELQEAREAYEALVLALPPCHRALVLENGATDSPNGERWPLQRIESCHRRMREHLATQEAPEVARIVRRAEGLKKKIDRAREALVQSNLRFVAYYARTLNGSRLSFLDLVQEANLGLLEAIDRFDCKRGVRLSTYAHWWMKKAVLRALHTTSRLIYVPKYTRRRWDELKRMTVERLAVLREPQPFEVPNENGGTRDLLQTLADPEAVDGLRTTLDDEARVKIGAALRQLEPRERTVLRLRYGIGGRRQHTLKEIADMLEISRERARQIERVARDKLMATREVRSLGSGRNAGLEPT